MGHFSKALLTLAALCAASAPLLGQPGQGGKLSRFGEADAWMGKVSSHLLMARTAARAEVPAEQVRQTAPALRWRGDLVRVEVRFDELNPTVVVMAQQAGLRVREVFYQYRTIDGSIQLQDLDELAAISAIASVRPIYGGQRMVGSTATQGDLSILADQARTTLAVDGSGVSIGILSDSIHDVTLGEGGSVSGEGCARALTGSDPQVSLDLPVSITVPDSGVGGATDEGAAMAEVVHDVASGAALMFHTASNSLSDFAAGIGELVACGADVIVDDFLYFAEPMFQDGLVAQAAEAAVTAGVAYVVAAGNQADKGVDQVFNDSNVLDDDPNDPDFPPTGNDFHDFGSSNTFGSITVPDNCGVRAILQWNEPFDSPLGSGASSDLDLYLCPSEAPCDPFANALASGVQIQGCGAPGPGPKPPSGDAFEFLVYNNTTGSPVTAQLAVEHVCGDENVRLRIATFAVDCATTDLTFEAAVFDDLQIYGHPAAENVTTVAAANYREIDVPAFQGGPEINVESVSSLGGDIPFYFDGTGSALSGAPITRAKPDLTGPDGVNTTFFGEADPNSGGVYEADDFPNFFGTSAAAAHVAGAAALLLEAEPDLPATAVGQILTASGREAETPGTDFLSGTGVIDVLAAVSTVVPSATGCVNNLVLRNQTVSAEVFLRACTSVTAGDGFVADASADLTFEAGSEVVLENGFSAGGTFTVNLDPSLLP